MKSIFLTNDKQEIVEELLSALNSADWKTRFCKNKKDGLPQFHFDEEKVYEMAKMANIGNFYSEEQAEKLLHDTILKNVDGIADWLISRRPIYIKTVEFDESIGYVCTKKQSDGDSRKIDTYVASLMLLKENMTNNTDYGFYICDFSPVLI